VRVARKGIALAVLFGVVACVDAPQPTAPTPYEGSKVSMTGTSSVTAALDGRLITTTTREWSIEGVVKDGLAEGARTSAIEGAAMPVLFISDASPAARATSRSLVKGKDGDFLFVKAAAGPMETVVHIGADRQIEQAYNFEWKKVEGGWLAMAFTLTVFKNGQPSAKIHSARQGITERPSRQGLTAPTGASLDEENSCIFDPKQMCDGPPVLSGIEDGGGSGGSGCCAVELANYLFAAATLAAATQAAIDNGTIVEPWVAIGLIAGAGYVAMLLMIYQDCYRECIRLMGMVSPTTTKLLFALAPSRDAREFCTG